MEPEGTLSFIDQETEEDFTETVLKKPEHSLIRHKKNEGTKKRPVKTKVPTPPAAAVIHVESSRVATHLRHGEIPTPAAIHAAKKKRELARNSEDIISVPTDVKPTSLVSDDDDDNSDDGESQTTRKFGPVSDASKQMQVLSALDNADSGSDEEKFIEEQIYKGVYSFPKGHGGDHNVGDQRGTASGNIIKNEELPPPLVSFPTVTFTPISVDSLQYQLNSQLTRLKEDQSSNNGVLSKLMENLQAADEEIEASESLSQSSSIRYQFFQEVKGYIQDLLLCLTEKVPLIEEMENSVLACRRSRADLLMSRRRQDLLDSMSECGKEVPWDEVRHSRIIERDGRRRRRREMRSKTQNTGNLHYDGLSSDDELLHSTEIKFQGELDEILSQREDIFSDVIKEFSSVFSVVTRFREWKFNFPASYNQAYISLCLPKLLAPYVSQQLISWNPLSPNNDLHLDSMSWLQDLLFFDYTCPEIDSTDPDIHLIPRVIESSLIPKLTGIIAQVWDPLSSTQTISLRKCILHLMEGFPTVTPVHNSYQKMWKAVLEKIGLTLEKDIFIPIFSPEVMSNSSSKQYQFSQRQFWTAFKLLENTMMWHGLLSNDTLQDVVVDGLINRYLLQSLQHSPVTELSVIKVEKIVALLPQIWWKKQMHLASFLRYVQNLISTLQDLVLTEPEGSRLTIRSAIDQALRVLSQIQR